MTTKPQVEPEGLADELERLALLATQGDWEIQDGCSWRRIGTPRCDGNVLCPDTYSSTDRHPDLSAGKGEDVYANLRLIVALQNNLPTILSALRSSTVNDELVEALRPFAEADERQIRLAGERGLKDGNASVLIPRLALRRARAALAKLETPDAGKERGE